MKRILATACLVIGVFTLPFSGFAYSYAACQVNGMGTFHYACCEKGGSEFWTPRLTTDKNACVGNFYSPQLYAHAAKGCKFSTKSSDAAQLNKNFCTFTDKRTKSHRLAI